MKVVNYRTPSFSLFLCLGSSCGSDVGQKALLAKLFSHGLVNSTNAIHTDNTFQRTNTTVKWISSKCRRRVGGN